MKKVYYVLLNIENKQWYDVSLRGIFNEVNQLRQATVFKNVDDIPEHRPAKSVIVMITPEQYMESTFEFYDSYTSLLDVKKESNEIITKAIQENVTPINVVPSPSIAETKTEQPIVDLKPKIYSLRELSKLTRLTQAQISQLHYKGFTDEDILFREQFRLNPPIVINNRSITKLGELGKALHIKQQELITLARAGRINQDWVDIQLSDYRAKVSGAKQKAREERINKRSVFKGVNDIDVGELVPKNSKPISKPQNIQIHEQVDEKFENPFQNFTPSSSSDDISNLFDMSKPSPQVNIAPIHPIEAPKVKTEFVEGKFDQLLKGGLVNHIFIPERIVQAEKLKQGQQVKLIYTDDFETYEIEKGWAPIPPLDNGIKEIEGVVEYAGNGFFQVRKDINGMPLSTFLKKKVYRIPQDIEFDLASKDIVILRWHENENKPEIVFKKEEKFKGEKPAVETFSDVKKNNNEKDLTTFTDKTALICGGKMAWPRLDDVMKKKNSKLLHFDEHTPNEAQLRAMIKRCDCVIVVQTNTSHAQGNMAKRLAKKLNKPFKYIMATGNQGFLSAVQECLDYKKSKMIV